MIVIYTPKVTNRIKYTTDFIFSQYFGLNYELTDNPYIAVGSDNLYINYSKNIKPFFYNIHQDDLLLKSDVQKQNILISFEAGVPVFFQATQQYNLRFDIFSCIFYLLSRYEEYLPHEKDIHERYKSSNSLLANKEFNFSPIVEIWLHFFKAELLKIKPKLSFKQFQFEYTPTFDIDNAFRYLGRNWRKHPPNIFKKECRKTLTKVQQDPFDIFDKILNEINRYKLRPIFFFLLSDNGINNSKVSPDSKRYKEQILKISALFDIGLHPSYYSLEENLLATEQEKLSHIINRNNYNSRQHFLKINFPEYYRMLIETKIRTDFSLSYPDVIGFRAGFSREFLFFDIEKNITTSLIIQPSCWMDATYEYYQPNNIIEIQNRFLTIFNQLKKINGNLVPIFHNDLLIKQEYWNFFKFINQQSAQG